MIDLLPRPAFLQGIDRTIADHHHFTFRLPAPLAVSPGQFVSLSIPGAGEFPVSTAAWRTDGHFEACIRRAGRATTALYGLAEGDPVGIRGPFGNGFSLDAFSGKDALLVAGGLGMAPLRALLQALLARRGDGGEIILLYGSREPDLLLYRKELEEIAGQGLIQLRFSVDFAAEYPWHEPGAVCRVGLVPELLQDLDFRPERTTAAVCGPPVLYGCVLEEIAAMGVSPARIFATLERRMQCGIGQCCHCVAGGVFVCRDGPVFSLDQLRLMPGATT